MTPQDAFWLIHSGLEREGPGDPASLHTILTLAPRKPGARVADVGCGPGGDIAGLLEWSDGGHVDAFDTHAPFIETVRTRFSRENVTAQVADMRDLKGAYDLIWCAGALYFLGVVDGLRTFARALAEGGTVAFSYPCVFSEAPGPAAEAFWEGEGDIPHHGDLRKLVSEADFEIISEQRLPDAAWEAYYGPLADRIKALRESAGPVLAQALDSAEAEISNWQKAKSETGYLQLLVRPHEH